MNRTIIGLMITGWAACLACSSSNDSSNVSGSAGATSTVNNSAAGNSSRGGAAPGVAGQRTTGGATGASTSDGREEVWLEAGNIMSCDDVCATKGYECAAVCGDSNDTAADTLYTYQSASGLNLNQQRQFGVCATPVDATLQYSGYTYALVTLRCCCLAIPVERIDGDPSQPTTCNDLCSKRGLKCYPDTDWDGLASTGLMATYKTIDGTRYIPGDCNVKPALTVNRIGNDEPLTAYRCGCVEQ